MLQYIIPSRYARPILVAQTAGFRLDDIEFRSRGTDALLSLTMVFIFAEYNNVQQYKMCS
eukprot:SAG31_NODE_965_length_10696_cov_10.487213_9_plen_60_part_00